MRISTCTLLAAMGWAGAVAAAEPDRVPAATQPAVAADLTDVITKLDDDNPKVRTQAAADLTKLGKDALPALRAGTKQDSPQIRISCGELIARIEHPEKFVQVAARDVDDPFASVRQRQGMRALRLGNAAAGNAVEVVRAFSRDVSVISNGRTVRIHEDPNGLRVQINEGGKFESFDARTPEELKAKSEEAFKVYQEYANAGRGK